MNGTGPGHWSIPFCLGSAQAQVPVVVLHYQSEVVWGGEQLQGSAIRFAPPPHWGLDGPLAVACVVRLVVGHAVLCLVEQCGGFIGHSVMEVCQSHFDFGVLALWGLWRLVNAWRHDGVLILLARYLSITHRKGGYKKLNGLKKNEIIKIRLVWI